MRLLILRKVVGEAVSSKPPRCLGVWSYKLWMVLSMIVVNMWSSEVE